MEKELAMIISALISNIRGSKEDMQDIASNTADALDEIKSSYPNMDEYDKSEVSSISKVLRKAYTFNKKDI